MAEIVSKEDELVMKLLHYFITNQNYTPIVLRGADNEIWLENFDQEYKIVRIVSEYIHNNEQFQNDLYKTYQVMGSISKKTLSKSLTTLSIFINLGENVNLKEIEIEDDVSIAKINKITDLSKYDFIEEVFPDILEKTKFSEKGIELFAKITGEITAKTEESSKKAEDIFKPKKPYITYVLIIINFLIYIGHVIYNITVTGELFNAFLSTTNGALYYFGGMNAELIKGGQIFRIITGGFNHIGLIHILLNMYSLYVIGSQLESYLGKTKYLIVYFFSIITASLLGIAFTDGYAAGASGAIFGLIGALIYFGYHYRVYLGTVIKSQIIPLLVINLAIGFLSPTINNYAHIGGLIGGALILMMLGVKYKSTKSEKMNGTILTVLYFAFLVYISFFR